MLCMSLNLGEAVQIGDNPDAGAVVKIEQKSGRKVSLRIATALRVQRLAPGIIPRHFVVGITGEPTLALAASR